MTGGPGGARGRAAGPSPSSSLEFRHRTIEKRVLLLLVFALAGCYRYAVAGIDTIAPDQMVRISLNSAGRVRIDSVMAADPWLSAGSLLTNGPQRLDLFTDGALQGRVVGPIRESLQVSLQHANAANRSVTILRNEVAAVDRRKLDPVRTGAFVGGGLGLAVLGLRAFHLGGRVGASGNQPPTAEPFPLRMPSLGR